LTGESFNREALVVDVKWVAFIFLSDRRRLKLNSLDPLSIVVSGGVTGKAANAFGY
jgi:hypothetical protein